MCFLAQVYIFLSYFCCKVEVLFLCDQQFAPTAINRRPWLNYHVLVTAIFVVVLLYFQSAHTAGAMQMTVMPLLLARVVALFIGKIALDEQLACEVVVAC